MLSDIFARIENALEYMRLCAPGLTRGEAADVEAILMGVEGSENYVQRLKPEESQ